MRQRFATIIVVCAGATLLVGALAAGPAADAAGLSPVVADCSQHLSLTHNYSVQELQNALTTMPAYISEYSECATVIQNALKAKLRTLHGGLGGSGGSFLPTWLLVVLIVLVLGGVAFATAAIRRRGGGGSGDEPPSATGV